MADLKLKTFIQKSLLKPGDLIIIPLLILLSFTPLVIFGLQQHAQKDTAVTYQAVLKVDGKEIKTFNLTEGKKKYTYKYTAKNGDYNLIEVDGSRIHVAKADCKDQLCVRQGWIEKAGQTIVCLPHKLVIEVQASDGSEDSGMIY